MYENNARVHWSQFLWSVVAAASLKPRAGCLLPIPASCGEIGLGLLTSVSQGMYKAALRVGVCIFSR